MSETAVPASIDQQAFSCPTCGAYTHQDWFSVFAHRTIDGAPPKIADHKLLETLKEPPPGETEEQKRTRDQVISIIQREISGDLFFYNDDTYCSLQVRNLHVSRCYTCKHIAIWRHRSLLYPPNRYEIKPNADLPEDVRADFDEARAVLELSPRSSAALLRLCIQKICKHLGLAGRDINGDIGELVKKGLHSHVQKALDSVRVIGNEAVHPGTLNLKDDRATAEKLFILVNRIAYDLITYPKELDAIYSDLPQNKLEGIERRDKESR